MFVILWQRIKMCIFLNITLSQLSQTFCFYLYKLTFSFVLVCHHVKIFLWNDSSVLSIMFFFFMKRFISLQVSLFTSHSSPHPYLQSASRRERRGSKYWLRSTMYHAHTTQIALRPGRMQIPQLHRWGPWAPWDSCADASTLFRDRKNVKSEKLNIQLISKYNFKLNNLFMSTVLLRMV